MIGAVHANRDGVVPTRNPVFAGKRRYAKSYELVLNGSSGSYTNTTVRFIVRIPSDRLHAIAFWTFEPVAAEDATFEDDVANPAAWLIAMDAWCRLENGKPTRANNIFGTRIAALPVPNSWESVTGVFEWRGTITVPAIDAIGGSESGTGTGVVPGTLWLTVYWEPAAGESDMPQEELEALFNSCHAEVQGMLVTFQVGPIE